MNEFFAYAWWRPLLIIILCDVAAFGRGIDKEGLK